MYQIYSRFGEIPEANNVLLEALSSSEFCPKCWLKYADILIEQGKYEEATKPIIKLIKSPLTSDSVNWSYVNYLKGVCQMAALISDEDSLFSDFEYDSKKVEQIYLSFYKALTSSDVYGNLTRKIKKRIEELRANSGVELPEALKEVINN